MKHAQILGISSTVFFLMFSHSFAGETEKVAINAALEWLTLVDEKNYKKSWEEASNLFKKSITKEMWEQSIKEMRPSLGELVTRTVKSADYATSLPGAPDGEYVVIQFTASFTNKKSAIETVTPMKDPDGQWRVSGYYIK